MVSLGGKFSIPKDAVCKVCGSKTDLVAFIRQPLPDDESQATKIWYYCKKCQVR